MKNTAALRWIVVAAVFAAMLAGMIAFHASAQSDFMRGDRMPYDAFDRLPKTDLDVPSAVIHAAFAPGDVTLPHEKILDWIKTSARAVAIYYGRFPVGSLKLLMVPVNGPRVRGGTTWGYRGAAIRVLIGSDADLTMLKKLGVRTAPGKLTEVPVYNPETFETDVPGIYVAGHFTNARHIKAAIDVPRKIVPLIADKLRAIATQ